MMWTFLIFSLTSKLVFISITVFSVRQVMYQLLIITTFKLLRTITLLIAGDIHFILKYPTAVSKFLNFKGVSYVVNKKDSEEYSQRIMKSKL